MIHEVLGRLDFGRHVGEGEVDALEAGDRLAELPPGRGVAEALLQCTLGDAEGERPQPDTSAVERMEELPEAVVHGPEHIFFRDNRVLQDQLPRVRGAPAELVLLLRGHDAAALGERGVVAHADPFRFLEIGRVLGHDERRYAAGLLGSGIGAGRHDEDLPDSGMRNEDLRAIEDIVVALLLRHRARAAGIRPGAGLGQPEPAQHLSRGKQRHVALLLLRRAEVHDGRRAERGVSAHRDGVARIDLRELVDHQDVGEIVHPGPSQLLRPRDAEQAQVGHPPHVVPREAALDVVAARARLHDLLREVAHHVTHLEVVLGEVEGVVHG